MRKDILERKDDILNWIKENRPKSDMYRILNCKPSTFNKYLKIMGIEYKGNMGLKGLKTSPLKKSVMFYIENQLSITTHKLKHKLFEENIKEKRCEMCNLTEWNSIEMPLELHHIDGNKYNNNISNLQILCPNCHAQTLNNSGKSTHKQVIYNNVEKQSKTNHCTCGKQIKRKSKMCEDCFKKSLRKVQRPTYEQLLKEVSESNYLQIGKKYGVSDNAIRKWIKQYEKNA